MGASLGAMACVSCAPASTEIARAAVLQLGALQLQPGGRCTKHLRFHGSTSAIVETRMILLKQSWGSRLHPWHYK